LARACEDPKLEYVPELCAALKVNSEVLNSAHTSALAWVEELGL
jgi:EAL and modified HD-GYP domain-containing signal transduction protein